MESLRNEYLLILSAWMVCTGSAQRTGATWNDPAWNDPSDGVAGKRSVFPLRTNVAVIIVVLTTLLTLAFLLLVYAKHRRVARNRLWRRRGLIAHHDPGHLDRSSGQARPVVSAGVLQRRDSGVERSVIDALPVFEFASLQGLKEGLECAVCLSRFEGSEVLRLLPKCRHAFHVACVDTWLESNATCPLCRQKVEADDVCMVYRNEDVEVAKGLEDRGPQLLQAFVQRENVNVDSVGRESESFRVPAGSLREPSWRSEGLGSIGCFGSGRKKEMLISEADEESKELQFSRRFAHRIVVADVMCQHRWSEIKHSDLLFLSSQMITTDSGRMDFTEAKAVDEIGAKTETADRPAGYSAQIGRERSMSEIIGFNRIQSGGGNSNTRFGEPNEQKWFSIAGKTVQWFGGRGGGGGSGIGTDKFLP